MKTDAEEIMEIIGRIGPVLLTAAVTTTSTVASALRRIVGMMTIDSNMENMPTFTIAFGHALDLARLCDATLVTMDRVRKAALAEAPKTLNATLTVLAIVRLTLACESRIVAAMTFRSRDEVDGIATAMNAAFNQTAEAAADDLDAGTYTAIIRLHGDLTRHLTERGRQLPRVISYRYPTIMPALKMSQLAYTEPSRYLELVNENSIVHPAFMPRDGKMLAVV